MENRESRRDFIKKGTLTTAGLLGLSKIDATRAATAKKKPQIAKKKKVIVEKTKKIYSSPLEDFKYCAWTDIAFWHGKYYIIFSRTIGHLGTPKNPGLVLIESTDLENWTEQVLPDYPNADDRDAKLFSTPDRLFAFQAHDPSNTYTAYTEDGTNWSSWLKVYPNGPDGPNFQCWRPKEYNGTYYMACDNTHTGSDTKKINLIKSTDPYMLDWQYVSTIMHDLPYPRHMPSEPEIVFLKDGRCIAFIRLNGVESPTFNSSLPGFAISSPPYKSWDLTVGSTLRFAGPAIHRFGDTILVVSRGEVGPWPGCWDIPGEPPSTPGKGREGRRMRTFVYTFDLKAKHLEFQAILPSELYFDSAYAGILPTGKDSAVVSWYDGDFWNESNIWLAHLRIV